MLANTKPRLTERVLEFDLSGLQYSELSTEFLDSLGKVLRFEGLLKYVALPRLTVKDDEGLEMIDTDSGEAAQQDQGSKM